MGKGLVHNYGIWKAKKGKFRFIAGTRAVKDDSGTAVRSPGPARSPTYHLSKALVKMLKVAIQSLQKADELSQQKTGLRCFWGIDSNNGFCRLVRVNGESIASCGMATYDFTTMYTSFSQCSWLTPCGPW